MPYVNLTLMSARLPGERYPNLLSIALLCAGIVSLVSAAVFCTWFYNPIPFADSWNIIDELVMNHGHASWELLWKQHNEHRMAIIKLLMWVDLFAFHGKDIFLFLAIFLTQLLEAALITFSVCVIGLWSRTEIRAVLGVALYCVFCPVQYEVFIWSLGIQPVAAYAYITLAYVAFTLSLRNRSRKWFAIALISALCAPLTLASGLLVWPGLVLLSWCLRAKARTVTLIASCCVAYTSAYLFHYVSPTNHSGVMVSLLQPIAVLKYVLIYFGSTWDPVGRQAGCVLAATALALVIGWTCRTVARRDASALRVIFLCLASTLMVSAFGTALGRLNFGLEQASASRYQTPALIFWSCIFVLCLDLLRQYAPGSPPVIYGATLAIMLFSTSRIKGPWQDARLWSAGVHSSEPALVAAVKDDSALRGLISSPYLTFRDVDYLRANGISVYDTFDYRRMGVALTSIYEAADAASCAGNFDFVEVVADPEWPGYRAYGWGWDKKLGRPIEKVIIVNESMRIVGLAQAGLSRPDVKHLVPGVTSSFTGWKGYINNSYNWQEASAYGELLDGHRVCPLPGVSVRHPPDKLPGL
jgi:hypothetical protein